MYRQKVVQCCPLACWRVGLFQNINIFWKSRRMSLPSFTRPEQYYFWHRLEAEHSINTKLLDPMQQEPDQGPLLIS